MAFTCINEIEISGGGEKERGAAAALVLATESADEDSASRAEAESRLVLRFESVDGLPEEELASIAPQFPGLSFTLVYFSLDGEFFGYARAGELWPDGALGPSAEAESADLDDDARDMVGRRHDGDGIAFVKERYDLPRR
jgi:hypothetical protein